MKKKIFYMVGLSILPLLAVNSHADESADDAYQAFLQARGEESWINAAADHRLANDVARPIPDLETFSPDPAKQALGFQLFHDSRLSANGSLSCSSCHMGMMGGADGRRVSVGINGALGTRNAPTVFNSAFNFRQFWDGRAFDLDEQSLGPISNPLEMGHDLNAILARLSRIPDYREQFVSIYPDGLTAANLGNAIAQHSRDMTRSNSRFNQFLNGNSDALSAQEQNGWQRFQDLGCSSCHNGINLGGNSYQRSASLSPLLNGVTATIMDAGLFERTGREQDRQVFKVPSLNNVAATAPYFHDGSVSSLNEAVQQMAKAYSGREIGNSDVEDIVSFLGTLGSGMGMMGGRMMEGGMMEGGMMEGGMMEGGMHQRMHQMHHGGNGNNGGRMGRL